MPQVRRIRITAGDLRGKVGHGVMLRALRTRLGEPVEVLGKFVLAPDGCLYTLPDRAVMAFRALHRGRRVPPFSFVLTPHPAAS